MFLITAIVNVGCVKDILDDLKSSNIEGVTLIQVKGRGKFMQEMQDAEEHIKLEIVVSDYHFKELAQEAIRTNARNIESGAGKMWVTPVLEVERIRTGETGKDALSHSSTKQSFLETEELYSVADTPAS